MKKVIKWISIVFVAAALGMGIFYGGMRLNDGPVEFVPWFTISVGGPFRSGELTASPDDWTFLTEREEVEMQTLNLNSSKTVWVSVVDGRMFIASGRLNTRIGRLWKQWPQRIVDDDRIILRVDDKLYEQRLSRITEGPDIIPVMTEVSRKYGNGAPGSELSVTGGYVWLFEVVKR